MFWVGLAVAIGGTALFTGIGPRNAATWTGDGLAVAGAMFVVPYLFLSQGVQKRSGTLVTVAWIYAGATACLVAGAIATSSFFVPLDSRAWFSIVGMALLAQLLGHSLLNHSLRSFTAPQVATATLMEPVFAAALALMFFRETISGVQMIGGLILLVGVWVCLRGEKEIPEPATEAGL